MNTIKLSIKLNLIGEPSHRDFLELLAVYGIARRGGSAVLPNDHAKRISSDINLLNGSELNSLIFNETILWN